MEQKIAQLEAKVKNLEHLIEAAVEVHSKYITQYLIEKGTISSNTPDKVIIHEIYSVRDKLLKG